MKLRLTQVGMESYSGQLADVWFEDGASIHDLSEQQIAYMQSLFHCETVNAKEDAKLEGEVIELGGKATAIVGDEQPEPALESEGGEQ